MTRRMAVFFLLMALVIGISLLAGCSAPPEPPAAAATPSYVELFRANEKAFYALPERPLAPRVALIEANCKMTDRITDMPADVGMFALVYCP